MQMNSRELMKAAMRREPTERIPTMPQICHDLPIRIEAAEHCCLTSRARRLKVWTKLKNSWEKWRVKESS